LAGSNGDRVEFSYVAGVRSGPAVYHFADGSVEVSYVLVYYTFQTVL
jgi:hypothetical protein